MKTQAAADPCSCVSYLLALQWKSKRVHRYKCTTFPTTGYARSLKFMLIWCELGGMVQDVEFSLHTVS